MQVRCGQCGTLFEADAASGPTAACTNCGYAVPLAASADVAADAPPADTQAESGYADVAREQLRQTLHVTCGKCGKHLTVGARRAGMEGRCPACGGRIRIPRPAGDAESELPGSSDTETADRHRLDLASEWQIIVADRPEPVEVLEQWRVWPLLAAVAALVVVGAGAGLWVGLRMLRSDEPPAAGEQDGRAMAAGRSEPAGGGRVDASPGASRPSTKPSDRPAPPEPSKPPPPKPPPPEPPGPSPRCEIAGVESALFASGGYHPAPPGQAYWRVTVRLTALQEPLTVHATGEGARLELADGALRCLGVTTAHPLRDGPARPVRLHVPPGKTMTATLVFVGPSDAGEARLALRDVSTVPAGVLRGPARPDPGALPATFAEQPPRNLKPALRPPVMAAIQSSGPSELRLAREGDVLRVTIPQAHVAGRAARQDDGTWRVALRHQSDELTGALRFFDGGRKVLLYLAGEPFHQITYARQ